MPRPYTFLFLFSGFIYAAHSHYCLEDRGVAVFGYRYGSNYPGAFSDYDDHRRSGSACVFQLALQRDGTPKADFILNQPATQGCRVLVAAIISVVVHRAKHAPWALLDYGFLAVISTEIADIFRSNSLKNGLLPVVVDSDTHAWLLANPGAQVEIDLETTTLKLPNGTTVKFPIEGFARYCLLNGVDELGYLLNHADQIAQFEQVHA